MDERRNIHATGLVIGGYGILIRGASGAGKSLLCLALLEEAAQRGEEASLVADDRLDLHNASGKLVISAPPTILGMIELRGLGIISRPYIKEAEVHLVVDLVDEYARMVEDEDLQTVVEGIRLPRCPVPKRGLIESAHQMLLVREAMRSLQREAPIG